MPSVTRVPIGDRIRTQRRNAGVTQRDLAEAVGVSPAYLSLIESDKRQIGGRLLHRIAERLGVPADAFTAISDDRLAADLDEVARRLPGGAPGNAMTLSGNGTSFTTRSIWRESASRGTKNPLAPESANAFPRSIT